MLRTHERTPGRFRGLALGACFAVVAAACTGGGDGGSADGGDPDEDGTDGTALPDDSGEPVYGGSITYGLDEETSGGWCLPVAQLSGAGITVAEAIYDTLVVPNEGGDYVPYLAESMEPNADFTEWTITLREGVTFHDGSPLNADVLVQNIEAWRQGVLIGLALADIDGVERVDDLTVRLTTRVPWVSLPAVLWGGGRLGIAAPEQLDDEENCARNLIGTGPFQLEEWVPNDRLVAVRNPDYWQVDEQGNQLPYLDQITFRAQEDAAQRVTGLEAGDLDVLRTGTGPQISRLRDLADAGRVKLVEKERGAEITHVMLNAGKPPFDNQSCRLAVAHGLDRDALNQLDNDGLTDTADQPFAPDTLGYQDDPGFPDHDPAEAADQAQRCAQELGADELRFSIMPSAAGADDQVLAAAVKNQLDQIDGISVTVAPPTEGGQVINLVIAGDYEAVDWTNFSGGDPDTLYSWWHSSARDPNTGETTPNLLNFNRYTDPVIDGNLERARSETDPDAREALYQEIGRRFAEQAYSIWLYYAAEAWASSPAVNGLLGPSLPNGDTRGTPLGDSVPLLGLWVSDG